MALFCIAIGTVIAWCGGRCAMPDGHCLKHFVVLAAVHGSLGLPGWRLFREFTLLSPFSDSSSSLIGLLASVDIKQQKHTYGFLSLLGGFGVLTLYIKGLYGCLSLYASCHLIP